MGNHSSGRWKTDPLDAMVIVAMTIMLIVTIVLGAQVSTLRRENEQLAAECAMKNEFIRQNMYQE